MPTFERGFKAWAERTASAVRRELGLGPTDPLDPARLARHLGIRVLNPLVDLPGLPSDVKDQLFSTDPWGWSAATLEVGDRTVVIYNGKKSKGRQASDIIHELAHVILGHDPAQVVFSEDGQLATRTFNQKQEDEANWLGWTLLLPRDALFAARRSRMADAQIAEAYGVTERLVAYRAQMTGVDAQIRRFRGARRG
jgi:IrrE N-terminal-like domain